MANELSLAGRVGRYIATLVSSIILSIIAVCVTTAAYIKYKFKK